MHDSDFVNNGQTQLRDPGSHENDARGYKQGWSNGITKREMFAAMILQGLCSWDVNKGKMLCDREAPCILAVTLADALIKELNKGIQNG